MSNPAATPSTDLRVQSTGASPRSRPCLTCTQRCHCWQAYRDRGPHDHHCRCLRYLARFDQMVTELDLAQPDPNQGWRLAHGGVDGWLKWAHQMSFETVA